jgi:hypothetical protein
MPSSKGYVLQGNDLEAIAAWAREYERISLDLGTGDGRFARDLARRNPAQGVMAVDTAGVNVRDAARRAPENARFIVGDALYLPEDITRLATTVTINFPWGSLLHALLAGDERLLTCLFGKRCAVRINAGAMEEAGYTFDEGIQALLAALRGTSPRSLSWRVIEREELKQMPTTWAKRLAFGRDPRAVVVKV